MTTSQPTPCFRRLLFFSFSYNSCNFRNHSTYFSPVSLFVVCPMIPHFSSLALPLYLSRPCRDIQREFPFWLSLNLSIFFPFFSSALFFSRENEIINEREDTNVLVSLSALAFYWRLSGKQINKKCIYPSLSLVKAEPLRCIVEYLKAAYPWCALISSAR